MSPAFRSGVGRRGVAGVLVLALVFAAVVAAASPPAAASTSADKVLMRGLRNAQAYPAGGRLYVAEQLNAFGRAPLDELMRVDPATGRVATKRVLGGTYDRALLADGSLWVATTRGANSWLLRLGPDSLTVSSKLPLGSGGDGTVEAYPTLTIAGGWLWVGYWNELLRMSIKTGKVTKAVVVRHAEGVGVSWMRLVKHW